MYSIANLPYNLTFMKVHFITLLLAVLAPFFFFFFYVSYKETRHSIKFTIRYQSPVVTDFTFAFVPISDTTSVFPMMPDSIAWPNPSTTIQCRPGKIEKVLVDMPKLSAGYDYLFFYKVGEKEEGSHRVRTDS